MYFHILPSCLLCLVLGLQGNVFFLRLSIALGDMLLRYLILSRNFNSRRAEKQTSATQMLSLLASRGSGMEATIRATLRRCTISSRCAPASYICSAWHFSVILCTQCASELRQAWIKHKEAVLTQNIVLQMDQEVFNWTKQW